METFVFDPLSWPVEFQSYAQPGELGGQTEIME